MDVSQYLRILREQWLLIVGCVMAATLIAGVVVWTATPIYQASTKLFVSTTTGDGPTGTSPLYQGSLFSQERVKSYADIVNSLPVTTAVVQRAESAGDPAATGQPDHGDRPAGHRAHTGRREGPEPAEGQADRRRGK